MDAWIVESEKAPAEPLPSERARVEGVSALANEELLALVLHGGGGATHTARARALLTDVPLWRLPGMRAPELAERANISGAAALRLLGALELGARATRPPVRARVRLASPTDVAALCAPRMAALPRERVVALMVDRRQRLLAEVLVSEGWTEGSPVDPREVFRPALGERASGVILVHNHPSGDPTPSGPDRELTRRLKQAGDTLGVKLVDHVVVAAGGVSSLAQEGLCG
ncbi:MAG: DNA repair protein RadC [Myxococcota bacterium]